ncbi:Na+/H+ antiporter NhaA [Rubinisphaera sp.]|uniref:Na+/H+ antiporter NhaA n=1 Tax=Rubinisphaera sp. TaxID=2024857 RepID=UPI000C10529E|nr:Na+/H+ antiporter NhaA [Rubinisphaera sp.]MBV10583.1 Na+/H+ antiporter NhaA [Rubinisphaera sp.]|tara:strand:+ start:107 stop:1450 length:1344 start_codon:yes stop_codon:yes gene_type:complete
MIDPQVTSQKSLFPNEPIHWITKPINRFLHVEAASGVVLLLCSVMALFLANSAFSDQFLGFWKIKIGITCGDFHLEHSLKHWINDGLMAIFFFVIGLEVKREIALGELRSLRSAALPVIAALGGMIVPAGIFLALQSGQAGQRGWGIPMATDIAFVVGCMAVLGRRVPAALRIILLSIAIVDDIGAILVIAFGYTENLSISWLVFGLIGIGLVFGLQRLGVRSIGMYTLIGAAIWLGFHESGIHATIAGVILGLLTPAHPYLERTLGGEFLHKASEVLHGGEWDEDTHRAERVKKYRRVTRETISPLEYLIHVLHPWVAFGIMPVFALANAGVKFQASDILSSVAMAVIMGLAVGKAIGIVLTSWLAVKTGWAQLPTGVNWRQYWGGGLLAGIGFTMALFIAGLAYSDETLLRSSKVGVLVGSLIAAILGMTILSLGKNNKETVNEA